MRLTLLFLCLATLVVGCSLLGSDQGAELSLRFLVRSDVDDQLNFQIAFTDRRRSRTIERNDFIRVGDVQFDAGPFEISTSGVLCVSCTLLDDEGGTLAIQGTVLSTRPDWRYSVSCSTSQNNPYRTCWGCSGFEARPLASAPGFAPGDSLFIVWGGHSMSNPVLY